MGLGIGTALLSAIIGGVGTAAGVIGQMDSSRRAKNQAEDAGRQAEQQAQQAAQQAQQASQQADQQFNRANQRRPDAMPRPAGAGGSTMLTGPQGIDPGALPLGKSTLLGQ